MNRKKTGAVPDEFLSTREAAAMFGFHEFTLHNWRSAGRYDLPWYVISGRIRYLRSDLWKFAKRDKFGKGTTPTRWQACIHVRMGSIGGCHTNERMLVCRTDESRSEPALPMDAADLRTTNFVERPSKCEGIAGIGGFGALLDSSHLALGSEVQRMERSAKNQCRCLSAMQRVPRRR